MNDALHKPLFLSGPSDGTIIHDNGPVVIASTTFRLTGSGFLRAKTITLDGGGLSKRLIPVLPA
jgi:hypothetical protein